MKIYSKFHDYYDSVLGLGVDETVSWTRTPTKIEKTVLPEKMRKWRRPSIQSLIRMDGFARLPPTTKSISIESYIVILAGKLFSGITLTIYGPIPPQKLQPLVLARHWCSSIDELNSVLIRYGCTALQQSIEKAPNKNKNRTDGFYLRGGDVIGTLKKHFSRADHITRAELDLLHSTVKSPVVVLMRDPTDTRVYVCDYICIANAELKDLGFASVVDPFTAYQEISSYISGVLGVESVEPVVISDKSQLIKKGFDEKSFKNRGTKKPRRKNKPTS